MAGTGPNPRTWVLRVRPFLTRAIVPLIVVGAGLYYWFAESRLSIISYNDHPTRSGSSQLSVRNRFGVAQAAVQDTAEEVRSLVATV